MNTLTSSWDAIKHAIPAELLDKSGKVFYSGRAAFSGKKSLYILGLNPGGDPEKLGNDSIEAHTEWVSTTAPEVWSAYRDERWMGKEPGCHGLQPRLLHMFRSVGLQPGAVPSSNLVFVRSRRETGIKSAFEQLANLSWPFHRFVIEALGPKVILCLGRSAGDYVRRQTGALQPYAVFTEHNNRRWQSTAYRSVHGLKVIVATHPSVADWTAAQTDPTALVRDALNDA